MQRYNINRGKGWIVQNETNTDNKYEMWIIGVFLT